MSYDIAVIGGGPAGLSAAINARARNKTVLVVTNDYKESPLYRAERVDNYLGMPGQSGAQLLDSYHSHAQDMGVSLAYVTLHVGLGTFRPVKEEEITDHEMHAEYCMISQQTADLINRTKQNGGRVICVGTTSCRTIESWAAEDGTMRETAGWTSIYIYPGYRFKVLDALITNFHLPESTLVMLVSALAGREHILAAYEEAVREKYRFFSFGDAMFIY